MNNRKQCITYREYKMILDDLRKETDILLEGTDFCTNTKKHYYYIRFKKFDSFPAFIGKVYKTYGKGVDIRTYYNNEDNNILAIDVRGLRKELK